MLCRCPSPSVLKRLVAFTSKVQYNVQCSRIRVIHGQMGFKRLLCYDHKSWELHTYIFRLEKNHTQELYSIQKNGSRIIAFVLLSGVQHRLLFCSMTRIQKYFQNNVHLYAILSHTENHNKIITHNQHSIIAFLGIASTDFKVFFSIHVSLNNHNCSCQEKCFCSIFLNQMMGVQSKTT